MKEQRNPEQSTEQPGAHLGSLATDKHETKV
jgi:hypothetical protein